MASGAVTDAVPLALGPVFAVHNQYAWLNQAGNTAGYLETVATLRNSGSGADGTQPTANQQPLCLAHSGRNYLHLPAVSGNVATVPDEAALDITGDISLEWTGVCPDFSTGANQHFASKGNAVGLPYSYNISASASGNLVLVFFSGVFNIISSPTTISPAATGLRAVRNQALGVVDFYERVAGVWSSLGQVTGVATDPITVTLDSLVVGAYESNGIYDGQMFRGRTDTIRIWNTATPDISAPVLDIDFATFADRATSGVAATGQTVTLHSSGGNPAVLVGRPLLYFDGVDDGFSIPGLELTGPKTLVFVGDWTLKNSVLWGTTGASHAPVVQDGDTGFPTENPPAGFGDYRKNGADIPSPNRDVLYDALAGNRSLFVASYTYGSSPDMEFSSYSGLEWQGHAEAWYIYDRILDAGEITKLETYLMNGYELP